MSTIPKKGRNLLPFGLALSFAVLIGALVFGYMILFNPTAPIMRLFRGQVEEVNANVVTGPYPEERDFILLKRNNFGLIISLLNPSIPYERKMLDAEKKLAAEYQIRFLNFPMNPISGMMGVAGSSNNQHDAEEAAHAAMAAHTKVYVHCYLGRHRVVAVANIIAKEGGASAQYAVRQSERTDNLKRIDIAHKAFDAGDYTGVVAKLGGLKDPNLHETLLLAWAHFRLNDIPEAKALFIKVIAQSPRLVDALNGLGYCDLRLGRAQDAERTFKRSLAVAPNDAGALAGVGIARIRMGKLSEAKEVLQRAVAIDPDNADAKVALARVVNSGK